MEPFSLVSQDLVEKFRNISNATVLGQLLKLGYNKTYMEGVNSLHSGRRLCGPAVTLRYLPSRPDLQDYIAKGEHGEGFNETPRWDALETLSRGSVLVADAMGLKRTSIGGDVVFSRILTREGEGLVTDGAVRDGHKVIKYGYPVFAGGSTPTVGEPNILPYEVNRPIQCGGVLVWPGDLILGDDDGVVVLPSGMAEDIYSDCLKHDEIEKAIIDYTQREKISPKKFYPFNDETTKMFSKWTKGE